MKLLAIVILLLCQLTTVNGQQTGCRIPVTLLSLDFALSSTQTAQSSQPIAQGEKDTVVSSPLSVDYYINQINLADSLYKNYLPQYNYDEVKAAVEFFDSVQSSAVSRQRGGLFNKKATDGNKLIAESRLQTAAKAHYYHAVGLTEREDVVGACEHYLKALEIMLEDETLVKTHGRASKGKSLKTKGKKSQGLQPIAQGTEEYEKIRFISLIYTRLGGLFLAENYCDLAISKYQKALKYVDFLEENTPKASIYKFLGNSYQLANKPDSALHYYNESLKLNHDLSNKLDVEKCVAQILFDKGLKDSAYAIIKNNFNKIEDYGSKYSYYAVIGDMYYQDNKYDSAINYFEKSIESSHYYTKIMSSTKLSAIYDSICDYRKKTFYNDITSDLAMKSINTDVNKTKLQNVYDTYKKRKYTRLYENEKNKITKKNKTIIISIVVLIIILILIIYYKIEYSKSLSDDLERYTDKLEEKESVINKLEDEMRSMKHKQSITDGKIKNKNAELRKKEEELRLKDREISGMKEIVARKKNNTIDFKEYCSSEVCSKILCKIEELSKLSKDSSQLEPLRQDEFALLLNYANIHLNNFVKRLSEKYPNLKKEDLYYICLLIINLSDKQIASLFGLTYSAIKKRNSKILATFGMENNKYLCDYLLSMI